MGREVQSTEDRKQEGKEKNERDMHGKVESKGWRGA